MAGDDERDRVARAGRAGGADRALVPRPAGEVGVGAGLAEGIAAMPWRARRWKPWLAASRSAARSPGGAGEVVVELRRSSSRRAGSSSTRGEIRAARSASIASASSSAVRPGPAPAASSPAAAGRRASRRSRRRRRGGPRRRPARAAPRLIVQRRHANSFRSRLSPSWRLRRAASGEQPSAAAISSCGRSLAKRSVTAARCFGGSAPPRPRRRDRRGRGRRRPLADRRDRDRCPDLSRDGGRSPCGGRW